MYYTNKQTNKMSKIIFIILGLIDLILCEQTYTKIQLKSLHQELIDRNFEAEIQEIVGKVVHKASIQDKETSYKHTYSTAVNRFEILNKKSDQVIIERLQAILIDADITITKAKCMYLFGQDANCKEILINW
jgi:predicted KAP-like P-loop ATPase